MTAVAIEIGSGNTDRVHQPQNAVAIHPCLPSLPGVSCASARLSGRFAMPGRYFNAGLCNAADLAHQSTSCMTPDLLIPVGRELEVSRGCDCKKERRARK